MKEFEEFNNLNHEVLLEFLNKTEFQNDHITRLTKAIMSQFVLCIRGEFQKAVEISGPKISHDKVVDIMVKELRKCVIDLIGIRNKTHKDELQ